MNKTMLVLGVAALGAGVLVAGLRRGGEPPGPPPGEGTPRKKAPATADPPTSGAEDVARRGGARPEPPDRLEPPRVVAADGPARDVDDALRSRRAERAFWEDMGVLLELKGSPGREAARGEAMARAARHLELDAARAAAFEAATVRALEEIADAWREREESWKAAVGNITLDPEVHAKVEREIQERYESRKRAALARLEALLPADGLGGRFRERLEEWIDVLR